MLTLGSKSFVAGSGLALAAAAVYWLSTADAAGSAVLASAAVALAMVAVAVLRGTGPADVYVTVAGSADDHDGVAPSVVPFVTALAVGCLILALAIGPAGLLVSVVLLMLGSMAWFAQARADGPAQALASTAADSGSSPFGLPLVLIGMIGFLGVMVARTLLAVTPTASWVVALIIVVTFLAAALAMASRTRMSRTTTATLVGVSALAILALGVFGLAYS